MAVLLEIIGLHIVAGGQAAAGAGRIIVGKHVLAKRCEFRIFPNVQDVLPGQIAEYFGLYRLVPAAGKTFVAMPQKVAGGDVAVPRYEGTPFLDKAAFPLFL